ncbi:MAG: CvpA family protein [Brachymonas sp.]|nr:CvpA family protein [Brachymonas sp.]
MMAGLGLFDTVCLLVLGFSCIIGIWRGFAFEVLSLAAWAGAFFAAQWGSALVAPLWPREWLADNGGARHVLTFIMVFIVTLLLLGLLASAVRAGLKKAGLRPFDRILGMGFGLLRAVLILWVVTVVVWLTPLHEGAWWRTSQAAPWLDGSLRSMAPVLPASIQQWLPPALRGPLA